MFYAKAFFITKDCIDMYLGTCSFSKFERYHFQAMVVVVVMVLYQRNTGRRGRGYDESASVRGQPQSFQ